MVITAADKAGVRLLADFTRIYSEIRFKAPECVDGTQMRRPVSVLILRDGDIRVIPTGEELTAEK